MTRGFFITFEGMEGSGKSTQIQMLADSLAGEREIIVTRSPGGTPIAEKIRDILKIRDPREEVMPETELLLFAACHSQMTSHLVAPALKRGAVILCDRFYDSTMAYQGYARGLSKSLCRTLNQIAQQNQKIDLTVFLDLSPEKGFLRKGGADQSDRLEKENLGFHKRVYEGFCAIADEEPQRVARVRATGTKYETHEAIMKILRERGII